MTTIPKSASSDPFYRYKRALLKVNTTNANGGTTHLLNLDKVAQQIERKPEDLLQYLKKTLHVNGQHKKGVGYLIKAVVTAEQLDDLLEEYILQYVICTYCNNPETTTTAGVLHCRACGGTSPTK